MHGFANLHIQTATPECPLSKIRVPQTHLSIFSFPHRYANPCHSLDLVIQWHLKGCSSTAHVPEFSSVLSLIHLFTVLLLLLGDKVRLLARVLSSSFQKLPGSTGNYFIKSTDLKAVNPSLNRKHACQGAIVLNTEVINRM